MKNKAQYIGIAIGLSGFVVMTYFYDWRLAVGVAMAMWGNNLQKP